MSRFDWFLVISVFVSAWMAARASDSAKLAAKEAREANHKLGLVLAEIEALRRGERLIDDDWPPPSEHD
jgi:hypothetical protein